MVCSNYKKVVLIFFHTYTRNEWSDKADTNIPTEGSSRKGSNWKKGQLRVVGLRTETLKKDLEHGNSRVVYSILCEGKSSLEGIEAAPRG